MTRAVLCLRLLLGQGCQLHAMNWICQDSQSIAWDGQDFQSTFPELEPAVWFSSNHPVFTVFAAKSAACHPTWFVNRNCDSHAPQRERERESIRVHVMIWDYQNWRLLKLASTISMLRWQWRKLKLDEVGNLVAFFLLSAPFAHSGSHYHQANHGMWRGPRWLWHGLAVVLVAATCCNMLRRWTPWIRERWLKS